MERIISKAVFPVAGLGTRFLPATKANPKEMLPIVDKPLIQYAVEEAIAAGIKQLIFVTSASKRAIEDHFDTNYELENLLQQRGQDRLLSLVQGIIPADVSCIYIRQNQPLGLGHAVLCAKPIVGEEPFAVLLADDLIDHVGKPCLQAMIDVHHKTSGSVLAVEEVVGQAVERYGIVALANDLQQGECRVEKIVEKPAQADAPSNLAVIGRYVLTPRIFTLLENTGTGAGGEIQLTDAIAQLLQYESVFAHALKGKRHDCGSHLGYLQATLSFALKHPELKAPLQQYLKELIDAS